MQIVWKGQSCFQITASTGKDSPVVLAVDPFNESIGLKAPSFAADIILLTHDHPDHNNRKAISPIKPGEASFLIDSPGEYEVKGVYIQGVPAFHDNDFGKSRGRVTIYTIEAEDLKICHLSDLGQKELFAEQIEDIGEVDVLLIPVGGNYTIDAETAIKVIGQIEPRLVVPMHYALPKLNLKLDPVEKFLKGMGKKSLEPLAKLTVKKKDLTGEETAVVVLKP